MIKLIKNESPSSTERNVMMQESYKNDIPASRKASNNTGYNDKVVSGVSAMFIREVLRPMMENMIKNFNNSDSSSFEVGAHLLQEHFIDVISENSGVQVQIKKYLEAQCGAGKA